MGTMTANTRIAGTKPPGLGVLLVGVSLCFLMAAAQPRESAPEELIRQANAAFMRGDGEDADKYYAAAEERTADPGLVAFNRAAVLFQQDRFRDAEVHYARVLDDAACPPERAAKAWYNRGTCLLRRGGSAAVYRSSIACFEHCLDSEAADEPLKADARHNLELAKTLWNEARRKDSKPDRPNDNPPPEDIRNDTTPPKVGGTEQQPGTTDSGDGSNGQQTTRPIAQQNTTTNPAPNQNTPQGPAPGTTPAPKLEDRNTVQPLSPEDTRKHLRETAIRLKKEQHALLEALYGPIQAGVRDW
jgi:tetratricopeptide (TPR) repeat protein